MAESNILEVKNLSIQFGGLRAVDGLNMTREIISADLLMYILQPILITMII